MSLPILLVVDDEPLVLKSLERLFEDDFDVLKAESGAQALELLRANRVDVLVSDQRMPGMTGVELFERCTTVSPATMRILLTGYADLEAVRLAVNAGEVFRYLTKPWSNAVLRETVRYGLEAARASAADMVRFAQNQSPTETPTGSVLILDPDIAAAQKLSALVGTRFKVHTTHDLESAMKIIESDPHIWLMISEVRIAGAEIAAFLSVMKTVNPALISIAATSIQDAGVVIRLINEGQILRFLGKPLDEIRLQQALDLAARRHGQLKVSRSMQRRFQVESSTLVKSARETMQQPASHQPATASSASSGAAVPAEPMPGLLKRVFALFRR
jgi:response regulator RpfG family c-di-GMP phosphodiesterase